MSNHTIKDWILDAIDQLKNRKARPDLTRIVKLVRRKHKLDPQVVQKELELLVGEEVVVKVDYKGSTSYRNAARWVQNRHQLGSILNPTHVSQAIIEALKNLAAGDESRPVAIESIEHYLAKRSDAPIQGLNVALDREANSGRIKRIATGVYALQVQQPQQHTSSGSSQPVLKPPTLAAPLPSRPEVKTEIPTATVASSPRTTVSAATATTPTVNNSAAAKKRGRPAKTPEVKESSPKLRGRPASKRRKIRKSHGPDFVESSSFLSEDEELDEVCGYCFIDASCNVRGIPEDLIHCSKCNFKAHPSCDPMRGETTGRAYRNKNWLCLDCSKRLEKEALKGNSVNGGSSNCPSPLESTTESSTCQSYDDVDEFTRALEEYPDYIPDIKDWTSNQLYRFLCHIEPKYNLKVMEEQEIDGKAFLCMRREDFLYLFRTCLGPGLKLYYHYQKFKAKYPDVLIKDEEGYFYNSFDHHPFRSIKV